MLEMGLGVHAASEARLAGFLISISIYAKRNSHTCTICHKVWGFLALWFSAGVHPFIGRTKGNNRTALHEAGGGAAVDVLHLLPPRHTSLEIPPKDPRGSKCHLNIIGPIQPYFQMKKLRLRVGRDWLKVTQQVGCRARTGLTMAASRPCSKAAISLLGCSEP